MNKIFKAASLLAAAGALLAACTKPEIGAGTVTATPASIEFEAVGAAEQTISINADGQWYIYAPEWLSVTPLEGNGNCELKIVASDNVDSYKEVCAPRADVMSIWSLEGASASVSVSQKGEAGLDATRTFVKVTDASKIDTGKQFLIVADNKGTLYAMSFFNQGSKGDDSYSYIDGEKVSANEDGSISYSGNKIQYTLAAKGDKGYTLAMSNGFMLWQNNDTYTNFYSTKDNGKASTFTISFDSETKCALIDNASAGNKRIAMDGSKNSFGAYTSTDGKILPSLYIDQAAPSTEVLNAAEKVSVFSSATSVSIPVTANCKWTVRNHDSWIKSFTKSGENDGSIEVTFDANTTGSVRTAEFLVIGQAGNIKVTLTQIVPPLKTIKELNKLVASKVAIYEFDAKDLVVTYVNGSNAFLEDETGAILLFLKNHGLNAGDKINGLFSGKCTIYNNLNELTSFDKDAALTITPGEPVKPSVVTLAQIKADFNSYISRFVQIKDVEVLANCNSTTKTGSIKTADGEITVYNKSAANLIAGSKGHLTCTPAVNNDSQQLNVWAADHFETTFLGAVITVKSSVRVAAGSTVQLGATVNTGATLSYKSSDESVATVSADGVVTGVKNGTATITIKAPAGEKYGSATATCTVEVKDPSPSVTIDESDFPTSYPKTETTIAVGSYDFYLLQVAKFENGIQFKRDASAYIANKTALPRITKIIFVEKEGKTHPTLKVYAGTSEKPKETEIPANGLEYDFTGGNYTYFNIVNGSSTSYLHQIIVEYEK